LADQGRSQPNAPNTAGGGAKKISGGVKFLSSFFSISMIISYLYNLCTFVVMQNKPQTQAICTRQSYISRQEKQRGSLGAEPLAVEGKWVFGGGAPDTLAITLLLSKKHAFLGICIWYKFMGKTRF